MAKEITVSVPDLMAAWLQRQPDMSAFVTKAIARQMAETTRSKLEGVGLKVDDERLQEARRKFEDFRLR